MRLIDADELLTHIEDYGEGQYRLDLISPYYVHNATTIDAISIPKHVTNGEMLLALFPDTEYYQHNGIINTDIDDGTLFDEDWWNEPYKGSRVKMEMSIDEIIKKENETADKYQKVVDTHIANDNGCTVEEMCGDDSEAMSKHLSLCKSIADYHKQIADTMRKYQQIEELIEYHLLRVLPKERMSGFQKDILEVIDNGNDD